MEFRHLCGKNTTHFPIHLQKEVRRCAYVRRCIFIPKIHEFTEYTKNMAEAYALQFSNCVSYN